MKFDLICFSMSDWMHFLSAPLDLKSQRRWKAWGQSLLLLHIFYLLLLFFCSGFVKSACLSVTQAAVKSQYFLWKESFSCACVCVCERESVLSYRKFLFTDLNDFPFFPALTWTLRGLCGLAVFIIATLVIFITPETTIWLAALLINLIHLIVVGFWLISLVWEGELLKNPGK